MSHRITGQSGMRSAILLLVSLACGCASSSQKQFASPQDAANSLASALRAHDTKQLKQILGPDGESLVSSGDAVADQHDSQQFLTNYDQKHTIVPGPDGAMILQVGDTDWPLPVPIVKQKNAWVFDTAAGKDEIVCRRIGRNELSTIQVCLAIADAERDYAMQDPTGNGVHEYAQKFFSDPGKKNGLYWETKQGEPASPLGPLAAAAAEEGYAPGTKGEPYHGYHFRLLKSQGASATGGAMDYVVGGKMIAGFAVLAFPAEYGNSGIMSFVVSHDGTVFQKDLGADTSKAADAITAYDPDATWKKADANENAGR